MNLICPLLELTELKKIEMSRVKNVLEQKGIEQN